MTHVKICGVTSVSDAVACAKLGVTAIGVNFVPSSPRRIQLARAANIVAAVPDVLVVGVVADMPVDELRAVHAIVGCVQFHGDEPPDALIPYLPHAYKAVRVATKADVERARTYPGDHILVDAKVEGALGGTGATFDWSLVRKLAKERKLTLAGGLTPDNVASAVAAVYPYCVDVASGVESSPGVKDLGKVKAFVEAARA